MGEKQIRDELSNILANDSSNYSKILELSSKPASFDTDNIRFSVDAGDTALTYDMKLIPMQTKLDLAILPIGYNFTMGIEDAIIASDFMECDKILGYHFDTFGYIEIDHKEAKQKLFEKDKDLILLEIGASIEL